MEQKSFESKANVTDGDKGIVHAVVSCFGNADAEKDVVVKGAFGATITAGKAGKFPPGVFMHDWSQPVAKTLDMWEEDAGLHVIGQFNLETQVGRETFSNIKNDIINQYSFGFQTLKDERKGDSRHILDVKMYEWSPVLWGMNEQTHTVGVKGLLTGLPYDEHSEKVLTAIEEFLERTELLCGRRKRDGREPLTDDRRERVKAASEGLASILRATEPVPERPSEMQIRSVQMDLIRNELALTELLLAR